MLALIAIFVDVSTLVSTKSLVAATRNGLFAFEVLALAHGWSDLDNKKL